MGAFTRIIPQSQLPHQFILPSEHMHFLISSPDFKLRWIVLLYTLSFKSFKFQHDISKMVSYYSVLIRENNDVADSWAISGIAGYLIPDWQPLTTTTWIYYQRSITLAVYISTNM